MYRRPIVTLIGNGDEITLDGIGSEFTLKPGMTGTGTAPREFTFSELARGGSSLRHRRNSNREIMIPVDVFHGYGEDSYELIEDSRRRLENLCVGPVEIRLHTKDGFRSAFGYLKSGLEGDFSKAAVNLYRMNLALTFVCNDPWWYGDERLLSQKVDAGRKPFLTGSRSMQLRRNLFFDPGAEYPDHYGWAVFGVRDSNVFKSGTASLRLDMTGREVFYLMTAKYTAGAIHSVGIELKATPNISHVKVDLYIGSKVSTSKIVPVVEDWSRVVASTSTSVNDDLVLLLSPGVVSGGEFQTATSGSLWADEAICEDQTTVGPYFDGDSPTMSGKTYWWDGKPGESISYETLQASPRAIPFFPVVLSGSTVQGAFEITIGGDAPVWPTWEIEGPGEDLLIQNDKTGERIFVNGSFTAPVTIDTREQDIYSQSIGDGSLWEKVSKDSVLFQLDPGLHRIRITLVNARPDSSVKLRYRETWRAGH